MLVSACADRWSARGGDGALFTDVEPLCRAQARESAARQLRFGYVQDWDLTGLPPDSRYDIERRETALCLQNKGFTLMRR
ncbi:MAG: hypothetical protein KJ667_00675 [Alphaproteobacteria bacterium]|nr:hypothetical protein [Alphaproteobacteria bacterium]